MSARLLALGAAAIALGGLVGCAGPLSSECTVAAVRFDATVTVSGPMAGQTCAELAANGGRVPGSSVTLVQVDGQPDATHAVVCQLADPTGGGRTLTIRDKGMAMLAGESLCSNLPGWRPGLNG